jgi:hypothetical protein
MKLLEFSGTEKGISERQMNLRQTVAKTNILETSVRYERILPL